ncbi:MAG: RidA family protein [Bacillota bacterium]|nr:RidA family protein [Bacillota bacterium]
MKQTAIFNEKTLGSVHGPYVQGTKYRDLFFTTQIATYPDGTKPETDDMAPNDYYEQTKRCLENAALAAAEVGSTLEDCLTCRIFILDYNMYSEVNRAYKEIMPNAPFPTRACIQVSRMLPNVLVEMEFIFKCEE